MTPFEIRPTTPADRAAIVALLRNRWGGETMVVHDTVYRPADLPAFVAVDGPDLVGLVTYEPGIESWHVLILDSLASGHGTGSSLLDRVERTFQHPLIFLSIGESLMPAALEPATCLSGTAGLPV